MYLTVSNDTNLLANKYNTPLVNEYMIFILCILGTPSNLHSCSNQRIHLSLPEILAKNTKNHDVLFGHLLFLCAEDRTCTHET